ncbi:MAG: hypothetical protein CVU41_08450 [Chloroflexi bacterium HGW-Chloroflexi-3]|nr:MAG: hypothetical protein CVU41_08450 [Chloroflexi bacterium HGW-Chloroflexi-3]
MRRFLLGIIIIVLFLTVSLPVQAQSEITIEEMQVKIWPEYDQPSVLVINNIFLSGDVKFPARINFNIPVSAGTPHSVAVRELDGQLYLLDYDMTTSGEWNKLSFTSPYADIWIEYYDSSLDLEKALRNYEFKWVGEYVVKNLLIEVQQPITATNMTFKESMGQARIGSDGFTYFTNEVGEIKANTKITLNLEYTKTDNTLSSSMTVPVQPVTPLTEDTIQGKTSFAQIVPFIIAGVGLAMLVIGVLWYMNKQKEILPKSRQRHVSNKRMPTHQEGDSIFCHRCGRRADSGDVFCRSCGTKLKTEE